MKKGILVLIPILILGIVGGLAFMGIINIPGITPKKADWKGDLMKIYKAKGSMKGNVVVLKNASKAETEAFMAAAKTGGLDPKKEKNGISSAKLIELIKKENAPPPVKVAAKKIPPPKDTSTKTPPPAKPVVLLKPEQGTEAVADLWNAIEVPKLMKIIATYKDPELASILLKMDGDKVSELLSQLPEKKAAALSRELQKQASIVPPVGA